MAIELESIERVGLEWTEADAIGGEGILGRKAEPSSASCAATCNESRQIGTRRRQIFVAATRMAGPEKTYKPCSTTILASDRHVT